MRLTHKTKLGKIGFCSLAGVVDGYEIYRLIKSTIKKVDTFLKGGTFIAEKFIKDTALDEFGKELCIRYIDEGFECEFLCKISQ